MRVTRFFSPLAAAMAISTATQSPAKTPAPATETVIYWARAAYGTMTNTPQGWKEGEAELDVYANGLEGCQLVGHSAANKSSDRNAIVRCYNIKTGEEAATYGCATTPGTPTNGSCLALPIGTTRQMILKGQSPAVPPPTSPKPAPKFVT